LPIPAGSRSGYSRRWRAHAGGSRALRFVRSLPAEHV